MASQQAIQPAQKQAPDSPIFVESENLFEQMKEFRIPLRAALMNSSKRVAANVETIWKIGFVPNRN